MIVRHKLVEALLSCRSMSNRSIRDTIVNELPAVVKINIGRDNADRIDVANIVVNLLKPSWCHRGHCRDRLLYVAMTRARDLLYVSCSRGQPSRFLSSVPEEYLKRE